MTARPNNVLLAGVRDYYAAAFRNYGAISRGVDWNTRASQELRFRQFFGLFRKPSFGLNDLGCGYGALWGFLRRRRYRPATYRGYDLSPEMIGHARQHFSHDSPAAFQVLKDSRKMRPADYTVASGIFNVKLAIPEKKWLAYILDTLRVMHQKSTQGFSFNLLTSYCDQDKKRATLYYGDPVFFMNLCMRNFSRHITLLHDYGLYEFTILVRKT